MSPLTGIELAAAALLVLAGAPKLRAPADTARALRSVGWRVPAVVVRAGGAAEAALGLIAISYGGRISAALIAASYAGFSGFVALARRRGGNLASCGCLGRPDTPPTTTHLVVTTGFAAACLGAAFGHPTGLRSLSAVTVPHAVAMVGYAALCTWLAWLALALLPRLQTAADGR